MRKAVTKIVSSIGLIARRAHISRQNAYVECEESKFIKLVEKPSHENRNNVFCRKQAENSSLIKPFEM